MFVSKAKIDQEKDADEKSEHTSGVGLIEQAKAADDEEENTSDKVDDELQLRNAAANDVVEKDAGDDDSITDNDSLQKVAQMKKVYI